jgi:tetratricopeptide (TPR) repeat protein
MAGIQSVGKLALVLISDFNLSTIHMKKIYSIAILGLILSFGSCKKMVDEQPLSQGLQKDFFKSRFDAEAAMAGMYGEFQATMIKGDGSQSENRITWWGEARSDNFERRVTYAQAAQNEIDFNGLTANNTFSDWSFLYSTIGRANLMIKRLPEIKQYALPGTPNELPLATEASYLAQCYTMRALCYFWIARVWGDAPIRTEPYEDLNNNPEQARDPQSKVLDQAIADLQKAYDMTVKNATSTVWALGEGAICATMADIYMWRKDYPNATIWFKNLFKAKGPTGKVYNLAGSVTTGSGGVAADLQSGPTWNTQFVSPTSSVESIFSIHWDYISNGCACMSGISITTNNSVTRLAEGLWSSWRTNTTDFRAKQTFNTTGTATAVRDAPLWKFYAGTFIPPTTTPVANYNFTPAIPAATTATNVYIPIYRLSDMYLLYAEALNQLGDQTNALKYVNLIRVRANLAPLLAVNFPDKRTLETAILQERQYELLGEGKRWFDLVRTDRVIEVMDPILTARQTLAGSSVTGWGTDKRKYYWPINRNVLNSNRLLVQNEPYNN